MPCFFYAARDTVELERRESNTNLRSLVRQLCCASIGGSILRPADEVYKAHEKDSFATGPLDQEECVKLISQLADLLPLTTIIIDALDECDADSSDLLLDSLKRIMEQSTGLVKILIASRDVRGITCHLEGFPNIMIKANDNRTDITRFVEHGVDTMIKTKKLLRGNVPLDLEYLIKQTLIERANGM